MIYLDSIYTLLMYVYLCCICYSSDTLMILWYVYLTILTIYTNCYVNIVENTIWITTWTGAGNWWRREEKQSFIKCTKHSVDFCIHSPIEFTKQFMIISISISQMIKTETHWSIWTQSHMILSPLPIYDFANLGFTD